MTDSRDKTSDPSLPSEEPAAALLSIGALSKATGIPVETLRTWERRYGFPDPIRRRSGHRRYQRAHVDRLLLVRQALEAGARAADALTVDTTALRDLLRVAQSKPGAAHEDALTPCLSSVLAFDGPALEHTLEVALQSHGLVNFLEELLCPLLVEIGQRWTRGQLGVSHEHFASEQVEIFLSEHWRRLARRAAGPSVVIAGLPGEAHTLGLHVSSWLLARQGYQVRFLGADTPLAEMRRAIEEVSGRLLVTALSPSTDRQRAQRQLTELTAALPSSVMTVAGGGVDPELSTVHWVSSFGEFEVWTRSLLT
jgi:MerR family transcriptional regulator, light-induced transcriptional regulator